ncbi:MAG TPA: alpha/beta hydrolase [Anaeromyxobacteraceae bacterium]|nr:alpha/beta hydrolase [Anaeromyxobacteraceae bacterium]
MEVALGLLAAIAGFLALALLHYAFWTRRLRQPIRDDGIVRAPTADGWRLALGIRLPREAERLPPVLLVHGLSANRWMLDAGVETFSLGAYLARRGFRTFALDLRGHGDSRDAPKRGKPWCFDDYVRTDVPAALDAVRRATGEDQVLWVGHSLGGVTGLVACQLYPERIAAIAAIAAPLSFDEDGLVARYIRWGFLVDGRVNRYLARMIAPFGGVLHPVAAELAINGRNVDRPVYQRILSNSIENVPGRVFDQMTDWVKNDACRSMDRSVDYRAGLSACRVPALFVSAVRDYLAPPTVVRTAYDLWGGPKELVEFSTATGYSADYGHVDLLLGKRAPLEVYPVVSRWLEAHSRAVVRGEARSGARTRAEGVA